MLSDYAARKALCRIRPLLHVQLIRPTGDQTIADKVCSCKYN
jgi:hypothetical protein